MLSLRKFVDTMKGNKLCVFAYVHIVNKNLSKFLSSSLEIRKRNFKTSSSVLRKKQCEKDYITKCKFSSAEKSRHGYNLEIISALITNCLAIIFFSYIIDRDGTYEILLSTMEIRCIIIVAEF